MHHAHGKRLRLVALAALAALIAPGAAQAHKLTTVAVDYRVHVLSGGGPGVTAGTRDGGRKLWISVAPGVTASVLGYTRRPFLRFTPAGVEVNSSSATAQATRLAVAGAHGWKRVSSGHSFAWADQRVLSGQGRTHWVVPLVVKGRRTGVTGVSWSVPHPAVWPWLAVGTGLLTLAALLLSRGRRRYAAVALAALAAAATVASLAGIALAGIGSPVSRWFQVGAVVAIGVAGIGFAARKRGAALVAVGIVGIVALVEGIAQLGIFRHAVVLSALPGDAARAAVAVAISLGLAVAVFSALQPEPARGAARTKAASR